MNLAVSTTRWEGMRKTSIKGHVGVSLKSAHIFQLQLITMESGYPQYLELPVFSKQVHVSGRGHVLLLYLPTQIRFPIGGERVTCHGSKLTNSLGRTKLTNSLGKQQLELSTRT